MAWDNNTLINVLTAQYDWVVEAEGDCISVSNDEGLDAFVVATEHQVTVETPLFPVASVEDVQALNQLILRTHMMVPLTTIAITTIGEEDFYVAFGALSSESKAEVVVEEIEVLFTNVSEFVELYAEYLKS